MAKISDARHELESLNADDKFLVDDGENKKIRTDNVKNTLGIDELQWRMGLAEQGIHVAEGRLNIAESDISLLEGRMDTAEADISQRELIENKKNSLNDNSAAYYPTQQAVKGAVDTLQSQISTLIIEAGTSDAETLQARTSGVTGETYPVLKDRLDDQESRSLVYDNAENPIMGLKFRKIGSRLALIMEDI